MTLSLRGATSPSHLRRDAEHRGRLSSRQQRIRHHAPVDGSPYARSDDLAAAKRGGDLVKRLNEWPPLKTTPITLSRSRLRPSPALVLWQRRPYPQVRLPIALHIDARRDQVKPAMR